MSNRVDDLLIRRVIGLAMRVHRILGFGFSETIYQNALLHELRKENIPFEVHPQLIVMFDGVEVGVFQADLIIDGRLIVELKAIDAFVPAHSAQLINYLAATKIEDGLLLNFGAGKLEFRTKTRTYHPNSEQPDLSS